MPTLFPDFWLALAAPFDPNSEVKFRPVGGNRNAPYITARTAMNRLDEVAGPENWWDSYIDLGADSYQAFLTVRLPDGVTVTKQDCGGKAAHLSDEDGEKAGVSDGFKRVAAKFGVGRYLYNDGVPDFAPAPAVGLREAGLLQPTNGSALWAWAKEASARFQVDLCQQLSSISMAISPDPISRWGIRETSEAYGRLAAYLAGLGLVSAAPPSSVGASTVIFKPAGPLTISGKDPLKDLKLEVKDLAKQVTLAWEMVDPAEGVVLEPDQVFGVLVRVVSERCPGTRIDSVRDCRDQKLLKRVRAALQEELGQIRAVREQA